MVLNFGWMYESPEEFKKKKNAMTGHTPNQLHQNLWDGIQVWVGLGIPQLVLIGSQG